MDGVGDLQTPLVLAVAALGRELLLLGAVQVGEGPHNHVAVFELARVTQRLEQVPHDLDAFFGASRPPGGLDSPDRVARLVERLAPAPSPTSTSSA